MAMEDLPVVYRDVEMIGVNIKNVPHFKIETSWNDNYIMSPKVHENVLRILEENGAFDLNVFVTVDYREV